MAQTEYAKSLVESTLKGALDNLSRRPNITMQQVLNVAEQTAWELKYLTAPGVIDRIADKMKMGV